MRWLTKSDLTVETFSRGFAFEPDFTSSMVRNTYLAPDVEFLPSILQRYRDGLTDSFPSAKGFRLWMMNRDIANLSIGLCSVVFVKVEGEQDTVIASDEWLLAVCDGETYFVNPTTLTMHRWDYTAYGSDVIRIRRLEF